MISMSFTRSFACLLSALLLTACANPKRGDAEFAPAMPVTIQAPAQSSDAIYQTGNAWLLHEDIKARRIGDMLTVLLEEQTDAEKTAETGITKSTGASITGTTSTSPES